MPRNGSGVYSLPQSPFVAGTVISSAAVNSNFSDIATALTGSLAINGSASMTGAVKGADGSTALPSLSFATDTTTGFSHQTNQISVSIDGSSVGAWTTAGYSGGVASGVPVGTIADFAGASGQIPALWYLCYGQAVNRTTYATLFTAISTTWGSGDGSTTFNLPDLRGTQTFGLDNMGGSAASRLTTTYFGSSPIVLGNRGGGQNSTLTASNIPTLTSSGSNSIIVNPNNSSANNFPFSTGSWSQFNANISGGGAISIPYSNGSAINSINFSESTQGITTTYSNSATAVTNISPAVVVNKIIFAAA